MPTNIIDTTFTAKDISSAASVYEYTSTDTMTIRVQVRFAAVAGGGDYVIYLALNDGDAQTDDIVEPKTTATLAAGETACWLTSTAVDVMSGDVINVMADGLAGDTAEAGSIRIFRDDQPADVWAVATRTLTQAASTTDTSTADSITRKRGDSWSVAITSLGALTGYTSLWFTIKDDNAKSDNKAVLQVKLNATGLDDGLLYLDGATAPTSDVDNASITVNNETSGDITVAVDESITAYLTPNIYQYDVQALISGSVNTLSYGTFTISSDTTRAVL